MPSSESHSPSDEPRTNIQGFGITGYRTLRDVQVVSPGPLTVICGPNNSGKSSLLEALRGYPEIVKAAVDFNPARAQAPASLNLSQEPAQQGQIAIDMRSETFISLFSGSLEKKNQLEAFHEALLDKLGPYWWVTARLNDNRKPAIDEEASLAPLSTLHTQWSNYPKTRMWAHALSAASTARGRTDRIHGEFIAKAVQACLTTPDVKLIQDIRRAVGEPLQREDLWDLAQASSRSTERQRIERWADALEWILQDVFGPDVRYEVRPAEHGGQPSGDFRLSLDGENNVPLESVGAGIREVVAIAYQALSRGQDTVLGIEEPENCLHPAAVKRLVRSLPHRAGVQLFVSTHASSVVNANPDSVIQLRRKGMTTSSHQVSGPKAQYDAIRSLGYSPADLVLTPCAVWVEGPSDRLYIVTWLEGCGLVEGVDYQVMYFGGALAAHVSVSADTVERPALAAIRNLSRYCAVVVDSDKDKKHAQPKKHVKRFREELKSDEHALLIETWGREVENYLPRDLANAIRVEYGFSEIGLDEFQYSRVIEKGLADRLGKVAFAEKALAELGGELPEAAKRDMDKLGTFISAAVPR